MDLPVGVGPQGEGEPAGPAASGGVVVVPVAVRASTSSHESPGVSAFQDGTSSVAPKPHSTSGDTHAAHS